MVYCPPRPAPGPAGGARAKRFIAGSENRRPTRDAGAKKLKGGATVLSCHSSEAHDARSLPPLSALLSTLRMPLLAARLQATQSLLVRRNRFADFVLARARELVDLRALFVELEGRHRLDAASRGNLFKLVDVDLEKDDVRHLLG